MNECVSVRVMETKGISPIRTLYVVHQYEFLDLTSFNHDAYHVELFIGRLSCRHGQSLQLRRRCTLRTRITAHLLPWCLQYRPDDLVQGSFLKSCCRPALSPGRHLSLAAPLWRRLRARMCRLALCVTPASRNLASNQSRLLHPLWLLPTRPQMYVWI